MLKRFVSDPKAPHMRDAGYVKKFWPEIRGKRVLVGREFTRNQIINGLAEIAGVGKESKLLSGCDCQVFYELRCLVDSDHEFSVDGQDQAYIVFACAALLEDE